MALPVMLNTVIGVLPRIPPMQLRTLGNFPGAGILTSITYGVPCGPRLFSPTTVGSCAYVVDGDLCVRAHINAQRRGQRRGRELGSVEHPRAFGRLVLAYREPMAPPMITSMVGADTVT